MENQTAPTESPKNNGMKIQIWIMLLMVAGVMAAGFLLMPSNEEQRQRMIEMLGTTNQGELVSPAVNLEALLPKMDTQKSAKWRIVVVDQGDCGDTCEQLLLNTRQVHVRLGREATRIQRILLSSSWSDDRQAWMKKEHPYLTTGKLQTGLLTDLLVNTSAEWNMLEPRYFVVNPKGDAILYYTSEHDGGGLLEDLKHLLKYSPDR